jgi:hypothetical protein
LSRNYALWSIIQGLDAQAKMVKSSSYLLAARQKGSALDKWQFISEEDYVTFFLQILAILDEKETPLQLLFNSPVAFFETYWPSLRLWLHRLKYTLKFETPLRLKQEVKYEAVVPELEEITNPYLYIGSLSDYLPALEVYLNGQAQVILKVDEVVSIVFSRIWSLDVTRSICRHLTGKYSEKQIEEMLRAAIKTVVLKNIPMFIYVGSSLKPKQVFALSLSCVGNPFEFFEIGNMKGFWLKFSSFQTELPSSKDLKPLNLRRRLFLKIRRFCKAVLFLAPLDEPKIFWEIYSKLPSGSVWAYIFAPRKFHISLNRATTSNRSAKMLHVSSKDPDALCIKLGPRTKLEESWRARMEFRIHTPVTHKLWLRTISFLLLLLGVVWTSAAFYRLGWFSPFGTLELFGTKCSNLASSYEFFSATVTFISFVLVARSWLIYEETVFQLTSIHFSFLLVFIAVVALLVLLL